MTLLSTLWPLWPVKSVGRIVAHLENLQSESSHDAATLLFLTKYVFSWMLPWAPTFCKSTLPQLFRSTSQFSHGCHVCTWLFLWLWHNYSCSLGMRSVTFNASNSCQPIMPKLTNTLTLLQPQTNTHITLDSNILLPQW